MQDWHIEPTDGIKNLGDLNMLAGLTVEEATSRVQAVGGRLHWYPGGPHNTFEKSPNRINVRVVDGRVAEVLGVG